MAMQVTDSPSSFALQDPVSDRVALSDMDCPIPTTGSSEEWRLVGTGVKDMLCCLLEGPKCTEKTTCMSGVSLEQGGGDTSCV